MKHGEKKCAHHISAAQKMYNSAKSASTLRVVFPLALSMHYVMITGAALGV